MVVRFDDIQLWRLNITAIGDERNCIEKTNVLRAIRVTLCMRVIKQYKRTVFFFFTFLNYVISYVTTSTAVIDNTYVKVVGQFVALI